MWFYIYLFFGKESRPKFRPNSVIILGFWPKFRPNSVRIHGFWLNLVTINSVRTRRHLGFYEGNSFVTELSVWKSIGIFFRPRFFCHRSVTIIFLTENNGLKNFLTDFFGHNFLTNCQSVKIVNQKLWRIGHKLISTNVFRPRSQYANSVTICINFGRNFGHSTSLLP